MANRDRVIETFKELVAVDSTSFHEKQIAELVKNKLSYLGIEAHEDNADKILNSSCGNIYAVWKGDDSKEPILLSAHLDTVEPGNGKKAILDTDNDVIKSDGSTVLGADDAAGIAEILEGIESIIESGKPHRTVELLFPVAEEVYTKGATVFDYSKLNSKMAYCFDLSGDVGLAAIKAPSLISFVVRIQGKASHAGFAPSDGINAILVAANSISKIKQGQVDDESTLNIGTIEGGVATNIVSENCILRGELRSFNHNKALELLNNARQVFEKEASNLGATIDFKYEIHLKAYEVDKTHKVIKLYEDACQQIGVGTKLDKTLGGADNHQFNANGINGIVVACGMENVHTTSEYIKINNLVDGAKLVEKLITI